MLNDIDKRVDYRTQQLLKVLYNDKLQLGLIRASAIRNQVPYSTKETRDNAKANSDSSIYRQLYVEDSDKDDNEVISTLPQVDSLAGLMNKIG